MSAQKQSRFVLAVLVLCLAGLTTATRSPGAFAVRAAPPLRTGPNCSLLDDPRARALMSGAFEMTLLRKCGRPPTPGALVSPNEAGAPAGESAPATPPAVGLDVRVNAIDPPGGGGSIQSETSLAVNAGSGAICAAFNDIYHWPGGGASGFSHSTDGGLTWQDGGAFPAGGGGVSIGDPSVAWRHADGYFYYAALHEYGIGLWRSTDECATFEWVAMVHTGGSDDKEFLAIDNNPTSPYYGRLYVAWTDLGAYTIRFVYSDDGTTWQGPITLGSGTPFGAWPIVAPNGDVYVAWLNFNPYPFLGDQEIVHSTDGGASFSSIISPATGLPTPRDATATQNCGRPALNGNIRHFHIPQIAIGPDGCLHVVYSYDPDGYDVGDVVNVYYRRSCDQGTSWEPEIQLNDDKGLTDQFFPTLTVNEDNVVASAWYDRRLDPADNYYFDRYWTVSYDGGTTWEPNERVSDVSSPVYATASCYHGDYDQMAYHNNSLYIIWSDDRVFFNGHYDPDIWFDQATISPNFTLQIQPNRHDVCRPTVVTTTVDVGAIQGYNQPVTLSDSGVPAGIETTFDPTSVFPLPGSAVYTVTVTTAAADGSHTWLVTGASPTQTHDVTITLAVSSGFSESPSMTWEPSAPAVGQVVTFTARATGTEPITFTWSFGDEQTGNGAIVTHTYAQDSVYGVTLTATNPCVEETVDSSITVVPICNPVTGTALAWQPITPTVNQAVTFTATATGTAPISFTWDFGDEAPPIITDKIPVTHTYTQTGTYELVLTAKNTCGSNVVERNIAVVQAAAYRIYLPLVLR